MRSAFALRLKTPPPPEHYHTTCFYYDVLATHACSNRPRLVSAGVPDAGRSRPTVSDHRAQEGQEVRAGPARVQPAQGPVRQRADRPGPAQGPAGPAAPGPGAVRPAGRVRRGRGVGTRGALVRSVGPAQVAAGRRQRQEDHGGPVLSRLRGTTCAVLYTYEIVVVLINLFQNYFFLFIVFFFFFFVV